MPKETTISTRTTICFTRETERQLKELKAKLGENTSQVIVRTINDFYIRNFRDFES